MPQSPRGQPFASRLQELSNFIEVTPNDEVLIIAQNGLTPANMLLNQFEDVRPALLDARPAAAADASWQDRLLGAVKNAVNLRPVNAEGDDPLVLLDQIGSALAAQNLRAAQALIQQLPEPMQVVAAPISERINAHLLIDKWQADMRASLLNGSAAAEGDAQ